MQEYEVLKLTKEEVKKCPQYSEFSDLELNSLIEIICQYSIIAYNLYNKFEDKVDYE